LGVAADDIQRMASQHLKELELTEKVKIQDNRFSTTQLSDGQRKRLALIVSFLENRELYVFDEWAADQDPSFKEVFYHTMLAQLGKQNKAVVVITHDDRYFHLADTIVHLEEGKIRSSANQKKNRLVSSTQA